MIIGVDEVGLGAICGPLYVGAVVLKDGDAIYGVRDSKKLREATRAELVPAIDRRSVFWMMARSSSKMIDKYGVARCTDACMKWVARLCLQRYPDALVIVDGNKLIPGVPRKKQRAIIKADDTVPAVSAASVLAKHHRDEYMIKLAEKWPGYELQAHKGYGTKAHLAQLEKLGPCPEHRRSYRPVAKAVR